MGGIILLFISLFLQFYYYFSINNTVIILLSIVCIIIQFLAISWDSTDYAYTSKNIFDTGRDWHWNARMLYILNSVILILSLLFFFKFKIVLITNFKLLFETKNLEAPIWYLCAIVTFIAAISAKPPIRREQTSKISMNNIENIVYNYLKENKGSAFTVCALGVRLENFLKLFKKRKYSRENLQMILNNLISSGKIDSTLHNGELHFFIPDAYQKEEISQPIPSIPEKIEEVPKVAPSDESQQVPPISEFPQQEVSEKATIDVSQLKTEELEPVPSIPEEKEEAPKEFSYTCKFCGMKLTKKANTCPQCGTILKP